MRERGNILFLILLAIILFVALSYAIMGQREQAPASVNKEQAETLAAQYIQEAALLEQNMMRARVINNIPEYGFDFSGTNSNATANNTCTAMPDPSACRVLQGGKGSVILTPDWATTEVGPYQPPAFFIIQIANVGTALEDIVYSRRKLRREVCEAVNWLAGVTVNLSVSDSVDGNATTRIYSGTLTSVAASGAVIGDVATGIAGRNTFCYFVSGWGYMMVHVLIPR